MNAQWCDKFATLLLIHHCCNSVTVLHLGNNVTIVSQCCRIATNISKVCVCVPIEHSLALILQGMRLVNRLALRCAIYAYGPKTLSEACWFALAIWCPGYLKINCANVAQLAWRLLRQISCQNKNAFRFKIMLVMIWTGCQDLRVIENLQRQRQTV